MNKMSIAQRVAFEYGYAVRVNNENTGQYPLYGSNGIIGYIDSYKVEGPGVIIGRKGSVGKITYSKSNFTPTDTAYYLRLLDTNKDNMCFWSYFLGTLGLEKLNTHSAVPGLSRGIAYLLEVKIPEKADQLKIAKVLSLLDSKIELNNRINTQLEAMAKLIYDYWFVQFDFPNAKGKPYKSSGGKMVYNEALKREIPKGWVDKQLSDIAHITMGQSPSGTSYNDIGEGIIFFQGSTDFGDRFPTIRQYTTEPSRLAKSGNILLSVRAPVGTLNIADKDCCIGRGLAALESKHDADSFLFHVMLHFKQIFDRRNTAGTTFGSITKDDLFSLRLAYPTPEILMEYDKKIAVFNKKILNNHQQNQALSKLRDWLLPMLMNGQVTVKSTPSQKKGKLKHGSTILKPSVL